VNFFRKRGYKMNEKIKRKFFFDISTRYYQNLNGQIASNFIKFTRYFDLQKAYLSDLSSLNEAQVWVRFSSSYAGKVDFYMESVKISLKFKR